MSTHQIAASAATIAVSLLFGSSAIAATELQWWHAMTGANNEVVDQLATKARANTRSRRSTREPIPKR